MKCSILATLLILAIGGVMGFLKSQQLTALRDDHRELAAQAKKLGISPTPSAASDDPTSTKRPRQDGGNEARAITAELIALAHQIESQKKSGQEFDEMADEKSADLMNRLIKLDASQLKLVIAGLRADQTLPEESRRNMLGFSIMMLGDDHPAAALALFTESSDLLNGGIMGNQVVSSSLMAWAKDDPLAALAWVRANETAHPDIADDDSKRSIIAGAALTDPTLAFRLIGEMKLDDASTAIDAIIESATTPTQRTATLAALRSHLATLPEGSERTEILHSSLESMGRNLSGEGFDAVKTWISEAKLTQPESARFAAGLSYFNTKDDSGRWIEWMSENLPEADARECADNLIGQWTQQDYLAAGKWLTTAPDGPGKTASIATYAETVAEYEPQVAVQWALTLPAGTERKATLENIYQNWPKSDAAAAAAFAQQHGINTQPAAEEP